MRNNSLLLWCFILWMALTSSVGAKTIYVATTGDDATGDGTESNPYATIQYAIDVAMENDTIDVAAGTYRESIFWESKSLVLQGQGAGRTNINADLDGDGNGDTVCMVLRNVPNTARIEGFTFKQGIHSGLQLFYSDVFLSNNTISGNSTTQEGGGVYLGYSDATLTNNNITSNSADRDGGGLYLYYSDPTLIDNTVSNNSAFETDEDSGGGGLYLSHSDPTLINNTISNNSAINSGGLYLSHSDPALTNNTISHNSVSGFGGGLGLQFSDPILNNNIVMSNSAGEAGGGLYLSDAIPTLSNNTVTDNTATIGGGMALSHSNPTLNYNMVADNIAEESGGGLHLNNSDPILTDNMVIGNSASQLGGGLYLASSHPTLTDNIVTGNSVLTETYEGGGGMYLDSSDPTLTGNIVTGNSAVQYGGGLYLESSDPMLNNNTISDNSATRGGGLYLRHSAPTLNNNTVSDNSEGGVISSFSYPTLTNNTITGNSGGGVSLADGTLIGNLITGNSATRGGGLSLGPDATVRGNTITGNSAYFDGGGVYLVGSGTTLENNIISGNSAGRDGGGVYLSSDVATLDNNTISDNSSSQNGGGLFLYTSSPTLRNNMITNSQGHGVYLSASSPHLLNNTIAENSEEGVIQDYLSSNPILVNCILWGNGGEGDLIINSSATYSDIGTGNTAGEGNISEDPLFVGDGDYHLQVTSPCINRGSNEALYLPDTDIDDDPRILDETVDMGADEVLLAPDVIPDLLIKEGPVWLGDDIYNTDATDQTAVGTVGGGETKVYRARLYNDGAEEGTLWIQGPGGDADWTVQYYWGTVADAAKEVTAKVTSTKGWKRANVPPGGHRKFLIAVTPASAIVEDCAVLVQATSEQDPAQLDCIQTITTVPDVQPDLWIKHGPNWCGNGYYNSDGTNQTGIRKVRGGDPAMFRAYVQNDGTEAETFRILGPSGDADWTVQYYRGAKIDASKEVTADVTSAEGWKRPNVAPGKVRGFLIVVTPRSELPTDSQYVALVRAEARQDENQRDTIKIITRVKAE